jgi:hypothetical protein
VGEGFSNFFRHNFFRHNFFRHDFFRAALRSPPSTSQVIGASLGSGRVALESALKGALKDTTWPLTSSTWPSELHQVSDERDRAHCDVHLPRKGAGVRAKQTSHNLRTKGV